jgi:hypothetical protein
LDGTIREQSVEEQLRSPAGESDANYHKQKGRNVVKLCNIEKRESERAAITKREFVAAGLSSLAAVAVASPAVAQLSKFGSRPLRIVVPFAAGGGVDVFARLAARQQRFMIRKSFGDLGGRPEHCRRHALNRATAKRLVKKDEAVARNDLVVTYDGRGDRAPFFCNFCIRHRISIPANGRQLRAEVGALERYGLPMRM